MKLLYFILDGDDIGDAIESRILEGNFEDLNDIKDKVQSGLNKVEKLITESNGICLYRGCDDITGTIEDFYKSVLTDANQIFFETSGFHATIGVGHTIQEAYLAMRVAKCKNKGIVSFWKN